MKGDVKANLKKQNIKKTSKTRNSKRKKHKKSNMSLYYLTTFLFVTAAAVVLSYTVFFRTNKIVVSGSTEYSQKEVNDASGIKLGTNLMRLNTKKIEDNIINSLADVETVKVTKRFPSQIIIDIEKAIPLYCIEVNDGYVVVSKNGKVIMDKQSEPVKGYIFVKGLNIESYAPGSFYESGDEAQSLTFKDFTNVLDKNGLEKITEIDISDRFEISIVYDDRVKIEIGGMLNIDYKVKLVKKIIEQNETENADFNADIIVRGDNSASVINKK